MLDEDRLDFLKNEVASEFDHYDCAMDNHDTIKANYHRGIIDGMSRVIRYIDKNIYDTRSFL